MRYFGTDGIRGTYRAFPITEALAECLGLAVSAYLKKMKAGTLVLGRDTRFSGESLANAFCHGLEESTRILDMGVIPTPAVSRAILEFKADLGVVITASHNPSSDNGFKLLGPNGQKLSHAELIFLEEQLENPLLKKELTNSQIHSPERLFCRETFGDVYGAWLRSFLPEKLPLKRLVIDASHGAASSFVEKVFSDLGCEVVFVAKEPDGYNINAGVGSEYTQFLSGKILEHGADLGIAFDGDGDRCVLCNALGKRIPGDQVLGMFALDLERRGMLLYHRCVVTVMSNLGLEHALGRYGIHVLRSDVGDTQVWHQMVSANVNFGGESSGHIIFRDITPCGDGMLTAIMFLSLLSRTWRPLQELQEEIELFPQEICSLKVLEKIPLEALPGFLEGCRRLQEDMGCEGQVLVRYSGTEPKVRLLVEAVEIDVVGRVMILLKKWVAKYVKLA
jgi:phosphoglucosamine mutase